VRTWAKRVGFAIVVLLLAIQVIPIDRHNPPVDPSKTIYGTQSVPVSVRAVLDRSCSNCHSDATDWPWYSYVAPASWVIGRDVHHARRAMNLSQWGTYPSKRKADKLEEMCEQLTGGDMPDGLYLLFHREARVTQQEKIAVCEWTENAREY
jgi:Haem-binding domain